MRGRAVRFVEGTVVVVTGGASGIGRACALEFARRGAQSSLRTSMRSVIITIVASNIIMHDFLYIIYFNKIKIVIEMGINVL